ncbi:hypothetical protein A3D77_01255 [Candidatus Gottesmanbacteria bacterium RIFCSPHIGHO2_02_FULL_39_11]|uniref:Uncharacterized protein n=1 Tax=Candidatus Gottesmanbacteria bacterium RIFCSPHIGHO2_02_FULL_39_11 TaxID=1798382 RepID=A0A1F5ZU92_9BACT|nr:MAG: hypothetical protein A3D77_01255 [Candidatus Gottesmanbacteria bacterium RIFCSPHIGHO2_02_FULL_39_11]
MKQKSFYFPHFKRTIAAAGSHLKNLIYKFTPVLFVSLISFNLLYPFFQEKTDEKKIADKILLDPNNPLFHENLGKKYITFNLYAAKREYALADRLDHFEQIKRYDAQLMQEYSYWQNIYSSFPTYDYAQLKLAEISYFKGDTIKTNNLINSILKKNPYDFWGLKLKNKILTVSDENN